MEVEGRSLKRRGWREQRIGNGWQCIQKDEAESAPSKSERSLYDKYNDKRRIVLHKSEALRAAWARRDEVEQQLKEENEPFDYEDYENAPANLRGACEETDAAYDELAFAIQDLEDAQRQLGFKVWLEPIRRLILRGSGLGWLVLCM